VAVTKHLLITAPAQRLRITKAFLKRKKQRLRIEAKRMTKGCRKIMKDKKRNKNKAC